VAAEAKRQAVKPASHNMRWTAEEEQLLLQGMVRSQARASLQSQPRTYLLGRTAMLFAFLQQMLGAGNWKAISAIIGTRTPLQVKNHARHLQQTKQVGHLS